MSHLLLARHAIPFFATRKVGGLRFFKLGRVNISFSISRKA